MQTRPQGSTHISMKFVLVINFKMPTFVGILNFMTRTNAMNCYFEQEIASFFCSITLRPKPTAMVMAGR